MKYISEQTFEQAFKELNRLIITRPEFEFKSRIGNCKEISNITYEVEDPSTYKFESEKINRIPYDYAEVFFDFMMEGGTDALEAFKDYPVVLPFIQKPTHPELPENFNSLYGPRIKKQLPDLIKELQSNPNSRRAVLLILSESDHALLDKDETIEYPCCMNITFFIRDGRLHVHTNMRSENTAVVLQLDMYLMGRIQETVATILDLPVGKFSSTMVSAHIFDRDEKYISEII